MKNDRVEILESNDNLSIIVSSDSIGMSLKKPGWYDIIMICLWLGMWLLGYLKAWTWIISGDRDLGLYLFLVMPTFFCLILFYGVLSVFVKHKLIITNKNTVKSNCHLLGYNIFSKREVFFENIKNIHIQSCSYFNFFQKNWHSDSVQGYLMLRLVLKADAAINLEEIVNTYIKKNRLNSKNKY